MLARLLTRVLDPRSARVTVAIARRDLTRAFANPIGYVFTTLFILLSAAAAFWRPRFFLNSLATLDQLNEYYLFILLFFVPALTMGVWSDERKQGTDELLLTLPTREAGIVLGKYLAIAAVYTVAVVLSVSHVLVLAFLGRPDAGLMVANYVGYWLAGLALIPVGMLASSRTTNATVAYVSAALACAVPVVLGHALVMPDSTARWLDILGASRHFLPFTRGLLTLSGIIYFAGLTTLMLWLNTLMLTRAPWRRDVAVRFLAAAVSVACLVILAERARVRLDVSAGQLSTLSAQTQALLDGLPRDRPVFIQAFLTPDVPLPLVQARENILDVLNSFAARTRGRVTVSIQPTDPFSDAATLARERFNILPRTIADTEGGGTPQDVFLGIAITSGLEEQVIPFVEPGTSVEYEVARALRVVTRGARKRLGVLDTDIKLLGGVDFKSGQTKAAWRIVDELRAQYDVVEVTPASAPDAKVDVLLLVLPSRLTQTELLLALEPVKRGVPTVMLLDPMPTADVSLSPAADLAMEVNPYRGEAGPARLVYADIRTALEEFGINWVPARIVWDGFNPHPDLAELPRESVFVSPGNGNPQAINRRNVATASLQEILLLYPGYFQPRQQPNLTFEPLLQTGKVSGVSSFFDLVQPSPSGFTINPNPSRTPDGRTYVMAASVRSDKPIVEDPGAHPLNLVLISDIDFLSDSFFSIRATAGPLARFDNIRFFENTVDLLAGDTSFIALRDRQPEYRTLERLESRTRSYMEARTGEEQQAQQEAAKALEAARARLTSRVEAVNQRTDLDAVGKQIMVRNLRDIETRQLRVLETNIARARDARVRASREEMEAQVRRTRAGVRTAAVLLPPLPVFAFGLVVLARRRRLARTSARLAGRERTQA